MWRLLVLRNSKGTHGGAGSNATLCLAQKGVMIPNPVPQVSLGENIGGSCVHGRDDAGDHDHDLLGSRKCCLPAAGTKLQQHPGSRGRWLTALA